MITQYSISRAVGLRRHVIKSAKSFADNTDTHTNTHVHTNTHTVVLTPKLTVKMTEKLLNYWLLLNC